MMPGSRESTSITASAVTPRSQHGPGGLLEGLVGRDRDDALAQRVRDRQSLEARWGGSLHRMCLQRRRKSSEPGGRRPTLPSVAVLVCRPCRPLLASARSAVPGDERRRARSAMSAERAPVAERLVASEPVMTKSKKAPHLAAVEATADSAPGGAGGARPSTSIPELERYATRAADRLRADAGGGEVRPPRQLAVGGRHRRGALLPGPAPRPRAAATGRAATASCSRKGHAAPIQYAALARHGYFPLRGPDGPAQARRAPPGPPRHDAHARASRSRPARSARASRCRLGIALGLRLDRIDDAHVFALHVRRRLPGGPDVGGRDGGGPLRRHEPDRDRRLQPPPDRRHDRGGHGHQGRAQEVRGLRVGRGRDRRPRHGRRRRGARVEPRRASGRPRSCARPARAAASR